MEISANSLENRPISVKFVEKTKNWRNKFRLVSLVVWYVHRTEPQRDFGYPHAQDLIDATLILWFKDLANWIFFTGISGLIIWFLLYMFWSKSPPFFTFFALGMLWWTIVRAKREVFNK